MSLSIDARTDAIYQAVQGTNPNFSKLSDEEQQTLRANIAALFGADLGYLITNTVVSVNTDSTILPGTIQTAGSPSAQTGPASPLDVSGTGTGTIS